MDLDLDERQTALMSMLDRIHRELQTVSTSLQLILVLLVVLLAKGCWS